MGLCPRIGGLREELACDAWALVPERPGRAGEQGVDVAQAAVEGAEAIRAELPRSRVLAESELRLARPGFGFEQLARAGDGVALVVEQVADAQGHLDIAAAEEALAGAALVGPKLWELGLPEAEDGGLHIAEAGGPRRCGNRVCPGYGRRRRWARRRWAGWWGRADAKAVRRVTTGRSAMLRGPSCCSVIAPSVAWRGATREVVFSSRV